MKELNYLLKAKDYKSNIEPTWCTGCGDFGVLTSLTRAMSELHMDPSNTVVVSGIGCSGRLPLWLNTYGFHSCHGRAIPVGIGLKMSRPDIDVLVAAGDGDLFSIGAGHSPHAARRNFDISVLCMDNHIYALTKNQVSPTSRQGKKGSFTPYGSLEEPINPIEMMIIYGATFVAQSYAGNIKHTAEIIKAAITHKGFSFVNILSPCPTFNHEESFKYYRTRIKNINEHDHRNTSDRVAALEYAQHCVNHIVKDGFQEVPVGIFYHNQNKLSFSERLTNLHNQHKDRVGNGKIDWYAIFDNFSLKTSV